MSTAIGVVSLGFVGICFAAAWRQNYIGNKDRGTMLEYQMCLFLIAAAICFK